MDNVVPTGLTKLADEYLPKGHPYGIDMICPTGTSKPQIIKMAKNDCFY